MGHSSFSQRLRKLLAYSLLGILFTLLLANTSCSQSPAPDETWRYSRFIQAVEAGKVEAVVLNEELTRAIFETQDGARAVVNLPNDPELVSTLERNNVDIVVSPTN